MRLSGSSKAILNCPAQQHDFVPLASMPEVVVEMIIYHVLESPISSSGLLEIVSTVRTNLSSSQRGASASCGKTQTCPRPQISTGSGLYHFSTSGSFQKTLGLIVCALKFQNRCVIERPLISNCKKFRTNKAWFRELEGVLRYNSPFFSFCN